MAGAHRVFAHKGVPTRRGLQQCCIAPLHPLPPLPPSLPPPPIKASSLDDRCEVALPMVLDAARTEAWAVRFNYCTPGLIKVVQK